MRKTYLADFNKVTQFSKKKRTENEFFLLECLEKYITSTFLKLDHKIGKKKLPTTDELVFFIGSVFYPKLMKTF